MKIRSIALAGCAAITFVAIASPNHAQAGDGFAAGLLGGFAAGAIVGSTMAPAPSTSRPRRFTSLRPRFTSHRRRPATGRAASRSGTGTAGCARACRFAIDRIKPGRAAAPNGRRQRGISFALEARRPRLGATELLLSHA